MSGYGPFTWSYGLSVLKSIAEPRWHYFRNGGGGVQPYSDGPERSRPPVSSFIGWALLRIVLCIEVALVNEMVGAFVLRAAEVRLRGFRTHEDPQAVAFICSVGGAISAIFVFLIDVAFSKPEERARLAMIDPNGRTTMPGGPPLAGFGPDDGVGERKGARNFAEGSPITLKKLRTHAGMRALIWPIAAVLTGAAGTAIWHNTKYASDVDFTDKVITGVLVQLTGVAVVVVAPTIIQALSLIAQSVQPRPRVAARYV